MLPLHCSRVFADIVDIMMYILCLVTEEMCATLKVNKIRWNSLTFHIEIQ